MKLKVNGQDYATQRETIAGLLEELDIIPERVAVEVNLKVIKRTDFKDYRINEGDAVEIVYFVGGGALDCRFEIPVFSRRKYGRQIDNQGHRV